MKLLYIVPRLGGAGGLQRIVLLKAGYLADKKKYNVTILVTNPDTDAVLFPVSPNINIRYIKPHDAGLLPYFFSYRTHLNNEIAHINPDAIIMCDNGLKSFFLPFLLQKKTPLIYEMHASKYFINEAVAANKLLRLLPAQALLHFLLSRFSKFIALTDAGAAEWKLNNSMVIPNPIWFSAVMENPLTAKKIIAMGRHTPQKGYKRMLSMWKEISKNFPDWTLEIYGARNPVYDVKKIADENNLERVIFSNPVNDIEKAYSQASINIMASESESFGMVLIEAMECGVPCIAFDCPVGPAAIIKDGKNGFLVADGDEKEFINRMQQLMVSHILRLKLGEGAKKTAALYNIGAIMEQWDKLFKMLVKGT